MVRFGGMITGVALVLMAPAAMAGEATGVELAQAAQRYEFNIPGQPLSNAIAELSRQVGFTVLYDIDLPNGAKSNPVVGSFSADEALTLMLSGAGVSYRFTGEKTITLVAETSSSGANAPIALPAISIIGEKTVRSRQDTATSVSVFTDKDIEKRPGVETLNDAMARMPNLVETGTGNFAPTIRGDDATGPANGVFAFLGGTRPRVTVQQDGRALNFNELVFGEAGLWDVEQVEVLRGPQTTLQGRNSIAGAIVMKTKDPTFDWESAFRGEVGSYDAKQGAMMVSGPLGGDELAVRVTADRRQEESWINFDAAPAVSKPGLKDYTNLRTKFLLVPNDIPDFTAKMTLNHTHTRRPQSEFVQGTFSDRSNTGASFPVFENNSNSGVLELSYDLTENLQIRNSTSYSRLTVLRHAATGTGNLKIVGREHTNELLAEYQGTGFNAVGGVYYLHGDTDELIDLAGGGAFNDKTETVSVFGEATAEVFDRVDLTLGARYERESRQRDGSAAVFAVALDETFEAFLPKAGVAWHTTDDVTVGATVQQGFNAGGAGLAFVAPFPSFTYDPEYVWNYEAYVRSSWLQDRLTVNANIFYADYKDQQRLAFLIPGNDLSGIIRNADESYSYGAEIETNWLATPQLELFATVGLLRTEIESFSASNENLDGNEFARSPDVTASIGANYTFANGISFGVDGRYVGAYFSEDTNDPTEEVDAHMLFNTQLAWEHENFRFYGYVTNIFDSDAELLLFSNATSAQLVDPREFGVGLQVTF